MLIYLGNPILRRETIKDKLGVLDVIAKIDNNENCTIEMQMSSQKNIVERLLNYWSGTYSRQLNAGDDYYKLQKTISILIANFTLPGLKDLPFHTTWKIIEEQYRKTILTDDLEIHIIELPKIINLFEENSELLDWLFFLQNPNSERVIEKMKVNKELKQANEKLQKISSDAHLKKIAEWREKAILEENTARIEGYEDGIEIGRTEGHAIGLKEGLEKGRAQGHASGLEEGRVQGHKESICELIKNMLANQVSVDKIALYTGCNLEEIEAIKNELNLK